MGVQPLNLALSSQSRGQGEGLLNTPQTEAPDPQIHSFCSGRQEAEHGRFLGEGPAFSAHLTLDRATLGSPWASALCRLLLLSAWG